MHNDIGIISLLVDNCLFLTDIRWSMYCMPEKDQAKLATQLQTNSHIGVSLPTYAHFWTPLVLILNSVGEEGVKKLVSVSKGYKGYHTNTQWAILILECQFPAQRVHLYGLYCKYWSVWPQYTFPLYNGSSQKPLSPEKSMPLLDMVNIWWI